MSFSAQELLAKQQEISNITFRYNIPREYYTSGQHKKD